MIQRPHLKSTVFSFETMSVVVFPEHDRVVLARPLGDAVTMTVDETLEAIEQARGLRKRGCRT